MAVLKMNMLSKALSMQTNVTICLPTYSFADSMAGLDAVYEPGMKYQALYLLHGGSGDDGDYVNFTNIVRYADRNKVAVIMPSACNSCYTDLEDGARYFEYIAEELPLVCRTLLPLSDRREDNFIGGLSMGAHGAMKTAINYPERYAAALLLSGASYRPGVPSAVKTKDGVFDFEAGLGVPKSGLTDRLEDADYVRGTVNDVYDIAKRNAESGKSLPKLLFRIGDSDHALYRTQLAERDLKAWGYDTQLEIVPGRKHEWDFWDESLRLALDEWLPLRRAVLKGGAP